MTAREIARPRVARPRLAEAGSGRLAAAAYADRIHCARPEDVWAWLEEGWEDLKVAALPVISLGFVLAALGAVAVLGPLSSDEPEAVTLLTVAFLAVLPFFAVGFFDASRRITDGRRVAFADMLLAWLSGPLRIAVAGLVLVLAFLAWQRLSVLIFTVSVPDVPPTVAAMYDVAMAGEAWGFTVFSAVMGLLLAYGLFVCGIVALPLMFEHRVDPVTAGFVGVLATFGSPRALGAWAGLCTVLLLGGVAVGIIGVALVLPLTAHGTWHAYRSLVSWPRPDAAAPAPAPTDRPLRPGG